MLNHSNKIFVRMDECSSRDVGTLKNDVFCTASNDDITLPILISFRDFGFKTSVPPPCSVHGQVVPESSVDIQVVSASPNLLEGL